MVKDDIIPFGPYAWQVLAVEDGHRALLITQDILELRWYHTKFEDITWANCALRHYLNETIYSLFSQGEKARILEITIRNGKNPWFYTPGGQDTTDHLFLLSLEEVCQYFGDSNTNLSNKGRQTWSIDDDNNRHRQARYGSDFHWWRLRSSGYYGRTGESVNKHGHVYVRGNGVYGRPRDGGGVRPALWLNLKAQILSLQIIYYSTFKCGYTLSISHLRNKESGVLNAYLSNLYRLYNVRHGFVASTILYPDYLTGWQTNRFSLIIWNELSTLETLGRDYFG